MSVTQNFLKYHSKSLLMTCSEKGPKQSDGGRAIDLRKHLFIFWKLSKSNSTRGGGGGGTEQSFIRGGSVPRSKRPNWLTILYTICVRKDNPFHVPYIGIAFHHTFNKITAPFRCVCLRYLQSIIQRPFQMLQIG